MTDTAPVTIQQRPAFLYLMCGGLIILILWMDLSIPLGVAVGVLYIAVVFLSLWAPRKEFTMLIAVITSLLTLGALFFKPDVSEMWKVYFNRSISLFAIWLTALLGLQRKSMYQIREQALLERKQALESLRVLQGMLPICASCKRIRDDHGDWSQLEGYIRDHSEAEFSHGICPECAKQLYPQFYKDKPPKPDPET